MKLILLNKGNVIRGKSTRQKEELYAERGGKNEQVDSYNNILIFTGVNL